MTTKTAALIDARTPLVRQASLAMVLALGAWMVWLFVSMGAASFPWLGLDSLEAAAGLAFAVTVGRRHRLAQAAALAVSVLLLADAITDVSTSWATRGLGQALLLAGAIELPIALAAGWWAARVENQASSKDRAAIQRRSAL